MNPEETHLQPASGDLNSPEVQFLSALWETWQALVTAGEKQLQAKHGLNLRTFLTLSYLQGGPQHPADLAREVGVPRYEISRVLTALDTLGAITRERGTTLDDGADGRGVIVRITPAGREQWTAALQTVRTVTGPPLAYLNGGQQHQMISGLRAVALAAHKQSQLHHPDPSLDNPVHTNNPQEN